MLSKHTLHEAHACSGPVVPPSGRQDADSFCLGLSLLRILHDPLELREQVVHGEAGEVDDDIENEVLQQTATTPCQHGHDTKLNVWSRYETKRMVTKRN